MGSKANYLENALLDHVFGGSSFSKPATVYVALFTVTPNDAGGGTEVSGNGYARVAVTNNNTNWPAASSGEKSNGAAITFPISTGSWGTVVAFGIFDAATSGNLLYWGALTESKAIGTEETPSFPVGDIDITED